MRSTTGGRIPDWPKNHAKWGAGSRPVGLAPARRGGASSDWGALQHPGCDGPQTAVPLRKSIGRLNNFGLNFPSALLEALMLRPGPQVSARFGTIPNKKCGHFGTTTTTTTTGGGRAGGRAGRGEKDDDCSMRAYRNGLPEVRQCEAKIIQAAERIRIAAGGVPARSLRPNATFCRGVCRETRELLRPTHPNMAVQPPEGATVGCG